MFLKGGHFLRGGQVKIASLEDPFPRGTIMGQQVSGPRLSEAEHFRKCPLCGGHARSGLA